ncbi:urea ABC transporter ATP-binding protein UrtD [Brotaphodocola sp.]|uniref:urea ABC transporter ATP-binding protein UrtD n=1 Tax=Brotaphodocola sp. TaxID=3073577 RepID=UPI003D7ED1A8
MEVKDPVLDIQDVSIKFGDFKAIKDVSTSVGKNEIRFFIGPNGAGKTTILDAICGKNKVSDGHIIFHSDKDGDKDVTKMREYKISDLGIGRKFQAPSVFGGITIEENIELAVARKHSIYCTTFLKLSKEKKDYMNYVLEFIGLQDKRFKYPGSLSHGEKQWLEIGMLMAAKPQLMLLDEPVAGMGRKETEKTAELLKKIKKDCSIIVVEHDMQFAKDVSDTVTVFHEGQVLDEGTMDSVQKNQKVIDVYLGRG